MNCADRLIFSFCAIRDVVHESVVLGNSQLGLMFPNVLDTIGFNLHVRIYYPLLCEWSSGQHLVKITANGYEIAVEFTLSYSLPIATASVQSMWIVVIITFNFFFGIRFFFFM
jgi:hypothetical protein